MLPQYKMVLINIILSSLLLLGIIVYKYIFKRKINLFYLLILISILPIVSIARTGTYESGDLSLHSKLAMPFYQSLREGNLIPQWADKLCGGYGCPDYIFMYIFPYYVISFFHFIGFSFIDSVKLIVATSFVASGIAMYVWAKEEFGKISAFVSAIFYVFVPYHLVNTHFRVDIAESVSYLFLPLNFLATKKIFEKKSKQWFILQVLFLVLLILSHQAVSLAFFFFIVLYGFLTWRKSRQKLRTLVYYFTSILSALLLSAFYWLPIIIEKQYVMWGNHAFITFPEIYEFFYSPWRYGFLFQGPIGQLSFIIGYIQWIIFAISIFFLFKLRKHNVLFTFFLLSFATIFFMMQSFSKIVWEIVPLIKNFQFTYRLLNLSSFFISAIAGIVVARFNNKRFIIIICFLAIFPTILNWGNRRTIPEIGDDYLLNEIAHEKQAFGDFTTPKWVNLENVDLLQKRKDQIEIVDGKAIILKKNLTSTKHAYLIDAKKDSTIRENTFYYPGWILKINNKEAQIDYKSKKYPGIITFSVNTGIQKVDLKFENTPIRTISLWVSIFTSIALVIFGFSKALDRYLSFPPKNVS